MNQPPNALLPGSGGSYRPPVLTPSITAEVSATYGIADTQAPLLSVAYPTGIGAGATCTLSKALLSLVPHILKGERRVLLVPPVQRGGSWFLNTMPPPGMGSRLPERGVARFRTHPIARAHFLRPVPQLAAGSGLGKNALATVANQNVFRPLLTFRLGPELQGKEHKGQYQLIPVR